MCYNHKISCNGELLWKMFIAGKQAIWEKPVHLLGARDGWFLLTLITEYQWLKARVLIALSPALAWEIQDAYLLSLAKFPSPCSKKGFKSNPCLIPAKLNLLLLLLGREGSPNHLHNYASDFYFPLRKYSISFVQPTPTERKLIVTHRFSFHWIFYCFSQSF